MLEKSLAKYVKLQNETKENFTIVSQEKKSFNYYDFIHKTEQQFKSPVDSADFYKDLEVIMKKRKLESERMDKKFEIDFSQAVNLTMAAEGVFLD